MIQLFGVNVSGIWNYTCDLEPLNSGVIVVAVDLYNASCKLSLLRSNVAVHIALIRLSL